MKVLFINPPDEFTLCEAPNEDGEGYLESDDFGNFPPLGLLYVLSYLEQHNPEVEIFFHDCIAERIGHQDLAQIFQEIEPDVVGITSFTIALVDIIKVAETARKVLKNVHICMGGHHPIAFPVQAALLPQFDSVVVGEGEIVFSELINRISKSLNYEDIHGLYTNKNIHKYIGKEYTDKRFLTHVNIPASYIDELDNLPIPNRQFLTANYSSIVGGSKKMATIITTRGCPYLCTFCDVPYKKYRTRSMENLFSEIEELLRQGYDELHFYDDLFNITPSKVITFCNLVIERKLKFSWSFRGRVNAVTEESIKLAKNAGCRQISFGVETGSDAGLKYLKKGTTTQKVIEAFKLCQKYKIRTIADYIIGFPFEKTKEDVIKNIDFLCKLNPDFAQIGILMVLPNTPLYFEAIEKKLIDPAAWEKFALKPTVDFKISHWEEHLSISELSKLQVYAYKRFYFNFPYILKQIKNIDSIYDFITKIKGALRLLK